MCAKEYTHLFFVGVSAKGKIMRGITFKLSWLEVELAAKVGIARHIASRKLGLQDNHCPRDGERIHERWGMDINGACGELAVAKAIGIYWAPTVNTFKSVPDVDAYEVRTTPGKKNSLIVRSDDASDRIYILVIGSGQVFKVIGWILGEDAKKNKWLRNPGGRDPACFVPQSALMDMCDLPI